MQATKEKIRQHLTNVGEGTAKQIAVKIGMKDYPSDVVNALSEMRTDAEVECEKRKGKGNELWYWLTNVASDAAMPTAEKCCNAAKVVATTAGAEVAELRQTIEALQDDIRRQVKRADTAEQAKNAWQELAAEYECKSAPDLRVFIEAQSARIEELKAKSAIPDAPKVRSKQTTTPRKPFTVTGLAGYHAGAEKVTLLLDRRLCARSITLSADKLNQLAAMADAAA